MGVPVKVELAPGKPAFLCCDGCREEAEQEPQKIVKKLAEIQRRLKEQPEKGKTRAHSEPQRHT